MLRAVHKKEQGSKASSLYCRWVRADTLSESPLIAVWMDDEMRVFEAELAVEAEQLVRSDERTVDAKERQCEVAQIEIGLDLWQP